VFSACIWPNFSIVAIGEQSFIAFLSTGSCFPLAGEFAYGKSTQGKISSKMSLFTLTERNMLLLYKFDRST
jgi:hypothetical protein